MHIWRLWRVRVSVIAILLFLASTAITGIIGNSANTLFVLLWNHIFLPSGEQLLKAISDASWPTIAILLFLLLCVGCLPFFVWKLNIALDTVSEIATFDTILLDCLTDLAAAENQEQKEEKTKKILRTLLKNATSSQVAAGYVYRASILLPDPEHENLKIWAHYGMSEDNVRRTSFYIGEDVNKRRGVAGETFIDGEIRIAHMSKKEGKWVCEYPSYIHFEDRNYTPYESFVSVPIVVLSLDRTGKHQRLRIGVVCFDSHHKWTFDNPKAQKLLLSLGERVGAVINLYWKLKGDETEKSTTEKPNKEAKLD